MKERPILFSGPMVRAILEGRKTQTRRVAKLTTTGRVMAVGSHKNWHPDDPNAVLACPYGQPGDRLIVKEHVWMWCEKRPNGVTKKGRPKFHYVPMRGAPMFYCADFAKKPTGTIISPYTGNEWGWRKKLGRFMPRWASRITLEVTGVRVERLQDISEEDADAEGALNSSGLHDFDCAGKCFHADQRCDCGGGSIAKAYKRLWESINGAGSWAVNPWVWVVEFRRITQ